MRLAIFSLSIHGSYNKRIGLTRTAVPPKQFSQIATPSLKRERMS
jgi:hypothetical protein